MLTLNNFFDEKVVAGVTDKSIDFSLKERTFLNADQRENLQKFIGQSLNDLALIRQVHGQDIKIVKKENCGQTDDADGLLTDELNLPLTIRTADCLPVFIYDPIKKVIGLVHAGWRGTEKGVLKNAIQLLVHQWKSDAGDLKVLFGPSIRSCCYQVGEEFLKYFPFEVERTSNGYYLDLNLANKNQLLDVGVDVNNIQDCGICTCCSEQFFSYRRQGEQAGRMLSFLMLK